MLAVLFIAFLQCTAAVIPMIKEQEPMIIAIDDVQGILYEIPEYEEAQYMDYELSAVGDSSILSLLQMAKKQSNNKERNIPHEGKISERQSDLDDIINRLQSVRSGLQKGNFVLCLDDIVKSIEDLKKLEHNLRPNVIQILPIIRQAMALAQPFIRDEIVISTMHLTPEGPEVEVRSPTTEAPVYQVEPHNTEAPTSAVQPGGTEIPVAAGTPVHEEETDMKPPPHEVEVYKNKYKKADGEKAAFQNKWAWRSEDFY